MVLWVGAIGAASAGSVCWSSVGKIRAEYVSGEEAAKEEATRAFILMQPQRRTPRGGYVVLHLGPVRTGLGTLLEHRLTLESGEVVTEQPPLAEFPDDPPLYGPWLYSRVLPVPDDASLPLTVWAIDDDAMHRCGWFVEENGRVWTIDIWRALRGAQLARE